MHMNIFHPSFGTIDNPRRDARYVRDKRIRGKNYRKAEMKKISEALAAERERVYPAKIYDIDAAIAADPVATAINEFGMNPESEEAKNNLQAMLAAMAKSSQVNSPALLVMDEVHTMSDSAFAAIKDATAIAAQIPRCLLDVPTPAEVDIAVGQATAIYRHVQGESTSERKNRIAREKRAIAKAANNA